MNDDVNKNDAQATEAVTETTEQVETPVVEEVAQTEAPEAEVAQPQKEVVDEPSTKQVGTSEVPEVQTETESEDAGQVLRYTQDHEQSRMASMTTENTEPSDDASEVQTTESPTQEPAQEAQIEETSSDTEATSEDSQPVEPTEETSATEVTDKPTISANGENPTADTTIPAPNENPNARWYVVHTYSGHENKVATTLKQKIETERLEEKILDVLVPVQDKIEIKGGKKATIKEKIFPGYILVKMVLDDISWLAVRTTQGVTSFVGIGNKPTPISEQEVQTIVRFTQTQTPVYKQVFVPDDTVKIVEGPFAEFIGKVDSVDEEKGKVRVLVSIFGRETPVELDFLQVQKI